MEIAEKPSRPTRSVEDLLGAYSIDDTIWGGTDPCDVSIDTANSAKVMAGSHITEEHTFTFPRFYQRELLNVAAQVPSEDDLSRYYDLDFLDNYHNWNKSPNVIDTINS